MQRSSFWLLLLATLYVSACTTATQVKPVTAPTTPAPATQASTAAAGEPVLSTLTPATVDTTSLPPGTAPLPIPDKFAPHIALIMPLRSTAFASSADAVQQGFLAATNTQVREFPVRIYSSTGDGKDTIEIYRQAIANGAVAIAGPLTRAGVTLLAAYPDISVPTLALNTTELKAVTNKLYYFGLIPETEARQIAQLAFAAKLRDATIINTGTALSKRLSIAFADEWKKLGGNINAELIYKDGDDTSALVNLPTAPWLVEPVIQPTTIVLPSGEIETVTPKRVGPPPVATGNVAFLAGDARQARLIRPYLNPSLPIYGTSQLFNINADTLTNYDLNDIRFVDMPWLLQPDHAAVMIYPRSATPLDTDKERLYAFGIDAYRLLNVMLHNKTAKALPLDGVSGRIRLTDGNLFQRDALPAFFKYGRGLTSETLAALEAEKAAAKAAENAARRAAAAENAPTPSTK